MVRHKYCCVGYSSYFIYSQYNNMILCVYPMFCKNNNNPGNINLFLLYSLLYLPTIYYIDIAYVLVDRLQFCELTEYRILLCKRTVKFLVITVITILFVIKRIRVSSESSSCLIWIKSTIIYICLFLHFTIYFVNQ